MGKKLMINCGAAMLLKNKPEVFESYEQITFNCGAVAINRELYAFLTQKNTTFNAGTVRVVDVEGEVVSLPENAVIDGRQNYAGCFLAGEDVLIKPEGLDMINQAKGIFCETLFLPQSARLENGFVTAETIKYYPDDAKVLFRKVGLDSSVVLEEGKYFIPWRLHVLDPEAFAQAKARGNSFETYCLKIYEGLYRENAGMFTAEKLELVPDGHTVVDKLPLTPALTALYGDKIFVDGDLVIQPKELPHLEGISSLVVKKTLYIPTQGAAQFAKIGKAEKIMPYEGTLLTVNGQDSFNHEQLAGAISTGNTYTIFVNGMLAFDSDVTIEDISCIHTIHYNGMLTVPSAIKAHIQTKIGEANGTIASGDDPISRLVDEATRKDADSSVINIGTYVL